jgi:hypothetical protein
MDPAIKPIRSLKATRTDYSTICVFRDSRKSWFFIFINSHVNICCIYPKFHSALHKSILYLKMKLLLPSYTYVSLKKLICCEQDRVNTVILPHFPSLRPKEPRKSLSETSEMTSDIARRFPVRNSCVCRVVEASDPLTTCFGCVWSGNNKPWTGWGVKANVFNTRTLTSLVFGWHDPKFTQL